MFWLFLLLIVAPLVELYAAIQVAHVIGGWNTLAALIVVGAVGSWLLRRQGTAVLDRVRRAVAEGRTPDRELVDGLFLAISAGLMIAPGFLSDVVAILLLLPPVRALLRPFVLKRFAGRAGVATSGTTFVGTFRVPRGGVYDATGRDRTGPREPRDPRELEP